MNCRWVHNRTEVWAARIHPAFFEVGSLSKEFYSYGNKGFRKPLIPTHWIYSRPSQFFLNNQPWCKSVQKIGSNTHTEVTRARWLISAFHFLFESLMKSSAGLSIRLTLWKYPNVVSKLLCRTMSWACKGGAPCQIRLAIAEYLKPWIIFPPFTTPALSKRLELFWCVRLKEPQPKPLVASSSPDRGRLTGSFWVWFGGIFSLTFLFCLINLIVIGFDGIDHLLESDISSWSGTLFLIPFYFYLVLILLPSWRCWEPTNMAKWLSWSFLLADVGGFLCST